MYQISEIKKSLAEILLELENLSQILAGQTKILKKHISSLEVQDERNDYKLNTCIEYRPLSNAPDELFIGFKDNQPLYVKMKDYPHIMLCGSCRAGKSKTIEMMLYNIMLDNKSEDVQFYISQIDKMDLIIFEHSPYVKSYASTLEKTLEMLQSLTKECVERNNILLPLRKSFVCDNVYDYNKMFPDKKMPIIYVVIEELTAMFSFFNSSREEAILKKSIISYIEKLMQYSGALGMNLILSVQRLDSELSFIKSNANNIISFNNLNRYMVQLNSKDLIIVPFIDSKKIWRMLFKDENTDTPK